MRKNVTRTYIIGHHYCDDNIKLYIVNSDSPENAVWEAVESNINEEYRRERFISLEEAYDYYGDCDCYMEIMELKSDMTLAKV